LQGDIGADPRMKLAQNGKIGNSFQIGCLAPVNKELIIMELAAGPEILD